MVEENISSNLILNLRLNLEAIKRKGFYGFKLH